MLVRNRTELTPELSAQLRLACRKFPTLSAICRACAVEPHRVREWLKAGQMPNADPLVADFSVRFLIEDAKYQEELINAAKDPYVKQPKVLLEVLLLRQDMSEVAEPKAEDVAEDWVNNCDPELVEMIRRSPMVPMLLDETTTASPEVIERLVGLGWAPPKTT